MGNWKLGINYLDLEKAKFLTPAQALSPLPHPPPVGALQNRAPQSP